MAYLMLYLSSYLWLTSIVLTTSKKVLILHPAFAGSHIFSVRRIAEELVRRGHMVKVIRWNEGTNIPQLNYPNMTEIILSLNNTDGKIPFMTKEEKATLNFPAQYAWKKGLNPLSVFHGFGPTAATCEALFKMNYLIDELKHENFDLALVELIHSECELALANEFGLNIVGYWSTMFTSGESQYLTPFNPPSYIPHIYLLYTDKMNFWQRTINTLYGIGSHFVMQIQFFYVNTYIDKYLKKKTRPSELLQNLSGVLVNSHFVLDFPKQMPPSYFHVGGIHVKEPKLLQKNLTNFIENSAEDIILFSLGLSFDSGSMPLHIYESYFKVFSRLKYKVIVKSKTLPTIVPPNVFILSYAPQNDILAHPKVKLFITHCGMHGAIEAIHHGVKMVGIPLFFDQGNIAARLAELGVAKIIDKESSETIFLDAIHEVLHEGRYETNIKKVSKLYHSNFEEPMDRAIWLLEHVMEHDGADYLKMKSGILNFFQYFCLDVFLFLFCLILLFILLSYIVYFKMQKFIRSVMHFKNKYKMQ